MAVVDSQTSVRASHWGFTLNNPTEEDRIALSTQPRWLRRVKYQDEIGENGTLHIQGYANTDQIRLSALKSWLSRAHFQALVTKAHIDNMLNYVHKEDGTQVANTQQDIVIRGANQVSRTMSGMLTDMAQYAWSAEYINERMRTAAEEGRRLSLTQLYEEEYWHIVEMTCAIDPDLIQTFTMPQYKVAWTRTRRVWVQKYLVDSQTNITINSDIPAGEIPVATV